MSSGNDNRARGALRLATRIASIAIWVWAFLGYLSWASPVSANAPMVLIAWGSFVIGLFIGIIAHETGHAVAALWCGWRIIVFVVRPFGWQIPNRSIAYVGRRSGIAYSGWILTVPRTPDPRARGHKAWILAGGPLANLLLAALAFAIGLMPGLVSDAMPVNGLAFGLGLQSLHLAIFSILPSTNPAVTSDGVKWRALRRGASDGAFNGVLVWLAAMSFYKARLRDLPDWMIAEAGRLPDENGEIAKWLAGLAIGRVLDAMAVDVSLARRLIDQYRASYGPGEWVLAVDGWLAAIWESDPDRARAALAEHEGQPVTMPLFIATEAAIAARTGDSALAHSKLKAMRKAKATESPFPDLTFLDIARQIEAVLQ